MIVVTISRVVEAAGRRREVTATARGEGAVEPLVVEVLTEWERLAADARQRDLRRADPVETA